MVDRILAENINKVFLLLWTKSWIIRMPIEGDLETEGCLKNKTKNNKFSRGS